MMEGKQGRRPTAHCSTQPCSAVELYWIAHQLMLELMQIWRLEVRTTVTLDDDLVTTAREYVDIRDTSGLLREALKSLIEREAARRLAALGGTEPGLEIPSRRRAAS
jgi:Arc/MetJ family transcription regulator